MYYRILAFAFGALVAAAGPSLAGEAARSIVDSASYQPLLQQLKAVVHKRGLPGGNHFYATNVKSEDDLFYLFWREGRGVWILNDGSTDPDYWESQIIYPSSGAYIDLDEDVVATKEEVDSSTYLVDRPWVSGIIYQAVVDGDLISVQSK